MADWTNDRVRRIDAVTGIVTTTAGTGTSGFTGDGGPATAARLSSPGDFALAGSTLLIADSLNFRLRAVDLNTGLINTIAGRTWPVSAGDGGPASEAGFNNIGGVAVARNGDILVTEYSTHRVRRIAADFHVAADTDQDLLDAFTLIRGNLELSDTPGRAGLILPTLDSVRRDFTVTNNPDLIEVAAPALEEVGGSVTISDNVSATSTDLDAFVNVGGGITISGNTTATSIDLDALVEVGGGITVSGNTSATSIDLDALVNIGGDMTVTDNTSAANIQLNSLESAGGDVVVGSNNTAHGTTAVTLISGTAAMDARLSEATFTEPTAFSVQRWDETQLQAESAVDGEGNTFSVDPIVGYQFDFAVPTLGQHAELAFELALLEMSAEDANAMRQFLAAELVTLAVLGDEPGAVMRLFDVVGADEEPVVGESVRMLWLDEHRMLTTGLDELAFARRHRLANAGGCLRASASASSPTGRRQRRRRANARRSNWTQRDRKPVGVLSRTCRHIAGSTRDSWHETRGPDAARLLSSELSEATTAPFHVSRTDTTASRRPRRSTHRSTHSTTVVRDCSAIRSPEPDDVP